MSRINVGHLLAAVQKTRGRISGEWERELKLAGEIVYTVKPLAGIHGTGYLKMPDGQVPSRMLNLDWMNFAHFHDLGPAKENPSVFNLISADLELANLRISRRAIDMDGYGVDVDGSGSVSFSGSEERIYPGVAAMTI